jgi:hypothetical protein
MIAALGRGRIASSGAEPALERTSDRGSQRRGPRCERGRAEATRLVCGPSSPA